MSTNAAPQSIPTRRIQINHLSELPNDYGTTPGGTLFSTTPGGTRLIYDRKFLLKCRDSPLARTPPSNLPNIPGVTTPDKSPKPANLDKVPEQHSTAKVNLSQDDINHNSMPQFGCGPWPVYFEPSFNNHFTSPPPPPPACTSHLALYRQRQQQQQRPPIIPFHPNFGPEYILPNHLVLSPPPIFQEPIINSPPFDLNNSVIECDSQLAIWRQTKAEKYFTMAENLRTHNYNKSLSTSDIFIDNNSNCVVYSDDSKKMHKSETMDPSIIACQPARKHSMDENANYSASASFY